MDNHWSTSQSGLPLLWCQLPSDDSLQLVEGGRARAVHLGLQVAREAEVKGGEVGGSRNLLPALQRPPADYVLCLQTGCPDTSCWHLCSGLKLQQGDSFFWWTVETDIEPGTTWYISQQNNKNTTTKSRNPTQKNIGRCTVKLPTIWITWHQSSLTNKVWIGIPVGHPATRKSPTGFLTNIWDVFATADFH